MITFEHTETAGWRPAIRGMRNAMESWDKSDSTFAPVYAPPADYVPEIGEADLKLMKSLRRGSGDERKFLRMIKVWVDITAPLLWWPEMDTYKVGTVRLSCSKMHRIHVHPFTLENFSHEGCDQVPMAMEHLEITVSLLEVLRQKFNETHEWKYWRALIELLPDGYNLRATMELDYEVLCNIYRPESRLHHKLLEWNVETVGSFCQWIRTLPYAGLITRE